MAKSECCGAQILWEVLAGMRVSRDVGGRSVYSVQCSSCRVTYEANGLGYRIGKSPRPPRKRERR